MSMRDAFLEQILLSMNSNEKIFFVCADFGSPVLDIIRKNYPKRFINVGIAEQNLINISAGLSLEGFTVFAYAIAPFITMRCFEQIRVNLALLSIVRPLNVNLIGVGAGYSYVVSGPTHQCYEDITLIRAMPNIQVLSPSDHISASALFDYCVNTGGTKYLRFDAQELPIIYKNFIPDVKKGFYVHRFGKLVVIVASGYMLHIAIKISELLLKENLQVGVIDLFNISNFKEHQLQNELNKYKGLVSMEEGFRGSGGIDSLFFDFINSREIDIQLLNIGIDRKYCFEIGTREELHEMVGVGINTVKKKVRNFISEIST